GVGSLHQLTTEPPAVLTQALQTKLMPMPGLPATVRQVAPGSANGWEDPSVGAAAARVLVEGGGGDRGEPSWASLGRMVQETQFAHVRRRAEFLAKRLGVDAGDYVAQTRPLVIDHPYRNLVEWYGRRESQGPRAAAALLHDID